MQNERLSDLSCVNRNGVKQAKADCCPSGRRFSYYIDTLNERRFSAWTKENYCVQLLRSLYRLRQHSHSEECSPRSKGGVTAKGGDSLMNKKEVWWFVISIAIAAGQLALQIIETKDCGTLDQADDFPTEDELLC
jgi:hypothetical protein